jgi:predicted permease
MIPWLLTQKILSLFLILLAGWVLVRLHVLRGEDSRVLSSLSLYLIMPCVILNAFQIDQTEEIRAGLLLAVGAAVAVHLLFLAITALLRKPLKLDPVERASVIYSNAGNLIIPLVTSILGEEWVIYSSAYVSVQLILLWSHGLATLCGQRKMSPRKILTNPNFIAILVGLVLFFTGLRFPTPVQDACSSVGSMLGPAAMLVTGMLIGEMNLKSLLSYRRVWLVTALRLILYPLLCLGLIWLTGAKEFLPTAGQILLVTMLATMTPSASTITQMAQIYGQDASYAGVINVITTLLCIVTMPCAVLLYQLI